jgi:hypothetical protein
MIHDFPEKIKIFWVIFQTLFSTSHRISSKNFKYELLRMLFRIKPIIFIAFEVLNLTITSFISRLTGNYRSFLGEIRSRRKTVHQVIKFLDDINHA